MKEITAWQTTDGIVYASKEEAIKAQDNLDKFNLLKEVVASFYYSGIGEREIVEGLMEWCYIHTYNI